MSFLKNAKIRTKILSTIVGLSVISISGMGFLAYKYKDTDTVYSAFIANDSVGAVNMSRVNGNIGRIGYELNRVLLNPVGSEDSLQAERNFRDEITAASTTLTETQALVPAQTPFVNEALKDIANLRALGEKVIALHASNSTADATTLLDGLERTIAEWTPKFREKRDEMVRSVMKGSDDLTAVTNKTITITLVILALAIIIGTSCTVYVATAGITTPISTLNRRMSTLAAGDTDEAIAGTDRRDEIGNMANAVSVFRDNAIERARLEHEAESNRIQAEKERLDRDAQKAREAAEVQQAVEEIGTGLSNLANGNVAYRVNTRFTPALESLRVDFNESMEKLHQTLRTVGENARTIDAGAAEIRQASDDLSKRTEQQAASVEETAAALEQITTTVKDATSRAEEAGALVERTRAGAERSGDVVRNAVSAMHQIEKSSQEISNIIGVIDDIAFQTNLLALNAGVEAARAGDAGKGFAVVAQEVRELAQRSANAAKEIKSLITTSGDQVRSGVSLVGETGKALEKIVEEVRQINSHVAAIVKGAREQAIGLQEINTAVNSMDQGTQQNAAMVEETTAASYSLAKEASSLNQLLSQFRMGLETEARSMAASSPRPATSPARTLSRKVASAFGGASNTEGSWDEF